MAQKNRSHLIRGVAAVIESAHVCDSSSIWVDSEDVPEALRQFRKLNNGRSPDIKAFTGPRVRRNRIGFRFL